MPKRVIAKKGDVPYLNLLRKRATRQPNLSKKLRPLLMIGWTLRCLTVDLVPTVSARLTSALDHIAEPSRKAREIRKVPISDIAGLA